MSRFSFLPPLLPSTSPLAADLFDPAALFWVGYSYHRGDAEAGIRPDGRQAMRFLELAAGMGHPGAAHYLARLYRRGARKVLQLRPHAGRAAHFLSLAVEGGHPEALFEAADAHAHGTDGAPVDLPRALELYAQAGRAGHVGALVSAGAMHYHGRGTPRDFARAPRDAARLGARARAVH